MIICFLPGSICLYFAGHGIALTQGRETAVFMANADPIAVGAHVIGEYIADWLAYGGGFEEVVLFMDCCREAGVSVPAPHKLWGEVNALESADVKRLWLAIPGQPAWGEQGSNHVELAIKEQLQVMQKQAAEQYGVAKDVQPGVIVATSDVPGSGGS